MTETPPIIPASTDLAINGKLKVATYENRRAIIANRPDEEITTDNTMCIAGLSQMMIALNWSGVEDQNVNMGTPFTAQFLAPIYGSIGTGTVTTATSSNPAAQGDTTMITEQQRAVVSSAGTTGASATNNPSLTWLFLFGVPPGGVGVTITEAGIFLLANSTPNNGSLLDHTIMDVTVAQSSTQLVTLSATFTLGNPS